jgi:hypothetical protein
MATNLQPSDAALPALSGARVNEHGVQETRRSFDIIFA